MKSLLLILHDLIIYFMSHAKKRISRLYALLKIKQICILPYFMWICLCFKIYSFIWINFYYNHFWFESNVYIMCIHLSERIFKIMWTCSYFIKVFCYNQRIPYYARYSQRAVNAVWLPHIQSSAFLTYRGKR